LIDRVTDAEVISRGTVGHAQVIATREINAAMRMRRCVEQSLSRLEFVPAKPALKNLEIR
jgi:hypothetical protein